MIILGIETTCDETAAAVLTRIADRIQILSNIVSSSQEVHVKYGGVVPEMAAREQIRSIIPVINAALDQAKIKPQDLSAIAVSFGPGLIGSLLVGVETAKTLSLVWNRPLIPINHLLAHFYANWIQGQISDIRSPTSDTPEFPALGLLVSGGHTDLVLFKSHRKYQYLGGTRDDAAGECFDKCARLLNLPYPGGPHLSRLATFGNSARFKLPVPMRNSKDLDFSFSGLKTAVVNITASNSFDPQNPTDRSDLAASVESTIIAHLMDKLNQAFQRFKTEHILIAGGVAANYRLNQILRELQTGKTVFIPPPKLCTDNAAMVAAAAFFNPSLNDPLSLQVNPSLRL